MIMTAAAMRETRVPIPAPAAPMPKPKISTALTVMLITFTTREQNMDTLLLPMARNRAAPAL